jgi:putative thioredoxin
MQAQVDAMLGTARQALADGDLTQAITLYQQILQAAPGNAGAIAGILRCNMAAGRFEQAQTILGQLPDELKKNPEIAAVIATLELAAEGTDIDVPMAIAALAANDDDHEARFNLAMAAYAQGDSATAIKELLEIVGRDRTWNDDGARKRLLRIFDALGPSDPEAKSGRRMLQMMLMV